METLDTTQPPAAEGEQPAAISKPILLVNLARQETHPIAVCGRSGKTYGFAHRNPGTRRHELAMDVATYMLAFPDLAAMLSRPGHQWMAIPNGLEEIMAHAREAAAEVKGLLDETQRLQADNDKLAACLSEQTTGHLAAQQRVEELEAQIEYLAAPVPAGVEAAFMRAKLRVWGVVAGEGYENLEFGAVGKAGSYDDTGLDEDNTFAKFTPSASLKMTVCNPALLGAIKRGDVFYVDFLPAAPKVIPAQPPVDNSSVAPGVEHFTGPAAVITNPPFTAGLVPDANVKLDTPEPPQEPQGAKAITVADLAGMDVTALTAIPMQQLRTLAKEAGINMPTGNPAKVQIVQAIVEYFAPPPPSSEPA